MIQNMRRNEYTQLKIDSNGMLPSLGLDYA